MSNLDDLYAEELTEPDVAAPVRGIQQLPARETSDLDELYLAQLPSNESTRGFDGDIVQPEPEVAVRHRRLGSGKTGRVNKPGAGRPAGSYGGSVLRTRSAADRDTEENAVEPVGPLPGSVQYAQQQRSLKVGRGL